MRRSSRRPALLVTALLALALAGACSSSSVDTGQGDIPGADGLAVDALDTTSLPDAVPDTADPGDAGVDGGPFGKDTAPGDADGGPDAGPDALTDTGADDVRDELTDGGVADGGPSDVADVAGDTAGLRDTAGDGRDGQTTEPDTFDPAELLLVDEPFRWSGALRLPAAPIAGASLDGWAWLCLDDGTLQPVDARDPAALRAVTPLYLDGPCQALTVDRVERLLWVADGSENLTALDISQPEAVRVARAVQRTLPVVDCEHDELWDWLLVVERGPDGDRLVRLDAGLETGEELATAELPGARVAHVARTPRHVVVADDTGRVLASGRDVLSLGDVPVEGTGDVVGLACSGDDVFVARADRVVRLSPDVDGHLVSRGTPNGLPGAYARFHGGGGTIVCGCGPNSRGVGVLRTRVPGSPDSVEVVGQLEGRRADFVLRSPDGGAYIAWGPWLGRLDVPPFLLKVAPRDGSAGVRPHAGVIAEFSEPVEPGDGGVTLDGPDGQVPAVVRAGRGGDRAVQKLLPQAPLAPGAAHVARVGRSVRDVQGLPLWADDDHEEGFETGDAHEDSPLERGGEAPLPAVLALDADATRVHACTEDGWLVSTPRPDVANDDAFDSELRVPGICSDLIADADRDRVYLTLAGNGLLVVEDAATAPRLGAVHRSRPVKPCRGLAADLPAGRMWGLCGARLLEWDLGGADAPQPVLARAGVDVGASGDRAAVAANATHVFFVDGAGVLGSATRADAEAGGAGVLEVVDFASDVYAPLGLGLVGDDLLVADEAGALWAVPLDGLGQFGTPRPAMGLELELAPVTRFDTRGDLLACGWGDGGVVLFGRAHRGGVPEWLQLGGRHLYPTPVRPRTLAGGALVAHEGGWSYLDAPPWVIDFTPEDGAINVPREVGPIVRYSEPVMAADGDIELFAGESTIPSSLLPQESGRSVRLVPAAPLDGDTAHDLRVGDRSVDDVDQGVQPGGDLWARFTTVVDVPTDCGELDCGSVDRECAVEQGVAHCVRCRPGFHEVDGRCVPDTCDDLDCPGERRLCDDSGYWAVCGDCLPGYWESDGICVPLTCDDLDCETDLRRCDDSGAYAFCGGCLPGHHESGEHCVPNSCADIDCHLNGRHCDESGAYAICGECLEGHRPDGDVCVPLSCEDLDCGERGRVCDDSGAYASCGGCLPDRLERNGQCVSPSCADLGCAEDNRGCTDSGRVLHCGDCLTGYMEAGEPGGYCRAVTCEDLDCAGVGRACDDSGAFARCGTCLPGHHAVAAGDTTTCVPTRCDDLDCGLWHRDCVEDGAGASCGGCLPGYHLEGGVCAADRCEDLDCGGDNRLCDDSGPYGFCGGCLPGYHVDPDGNCVPNGCADIDCEGNYRSCDDSGPFAICGGCVDGYHADPDDPDDPNRACLPDGCDDLDCATGFRSCDDSGPFARCGGCLPGYRAVADGDGDTCAPDGCDDLDCATGFRSCDESGPYARCGGCLNGYRDVDGDCTPNTCGDLDCAGRGRACDDTGPFAYCGDCLPGYHPSPEPEDGSCVPDGCGELDCAAQHRACDDESVPARCGGCLTGYELSGDACVPDGCEDAGCAALHRACDPSGDDAICTDCLPGYEELDGLCEPGPCLGRECGPDGRGGVCGTCGFGEFCADVGLCRPFERPRPRPLGPVTIYLDRETLLADRAEPDMVVRPVLAIDGLRVSVLGDVEGIAPGDEVMLINQQGSAADDSYVGAYALHAVRDVDPDTAEVLLHWPVTTALAPAGNTDLSGQRLVLIRVPHYDSLSLPTDLTLTASAWDGASGGVLTFSVDGAFDIAAGAVVTMDSRGYRGGAKGSGGCNAGSTCAHGQQGESILGTGARTRAANVGGGAGGATHGANGGDWGDGGGGGAHFGAASGGDGGTPAGDVHAPHGPMRLYLGSGGGGGGSDPVNLGNDLHHATNGGRGGGLVHIRALTLANQGAVVARGANAGDAGSTPGTEGYEAGSGGAGSGGTIWVHAPAVPAVDGDCELVGGPVISTEDTPFADAEEHLRFETAGQWADCGAASRLGSGRGNWSASVWFLRAADEEAGWLYSERSDDGSEYLELSVTADGRLRFRGADSAGRTIALDSGAGTAADGAWHHAVVTHGNDISRLYLDGVRVASASGAFGAAAVTRVAIGARAPVDGGDGDGDPSGFFTAGRVDELATFPQALTAARVASLHYHALHDRQPWETRLVQRQPTAFWRVTDDPDSLLNHADALMGFGLMDARGGQRNGGCSTACGGRGGDGRLVRAQRMADLELDGVENLTDTCFLARDPQQLDTDGDGDGDLCEDDWDGDGVIDPWDAFPDDPTESADSDGDGYGDNIDCRPNDPANWAPSCEGRVCGGDGCGGVCGFCDTSQYCSREGACVDFEVHPPAVVTTTVNLSTQSLTEGRITPDMATFAVASIEGTRVTTTATDLSAIAPGNEVMIITLQGTTANYDSVGTTGLYIVEAIEGADLVLSEPVSQTFGPEGNLDFAAQGQKVAVLRVPHYESVTVQPGGSIVASSWNGSLGGVLAFVVHGELYIDAGASVSMAGRGYRYGARGSAAYYATQTGCRGQAGESFGGQGARGTSRNLSGGGGGNSGGSSGSGDWGSAGGPGSFTTSGTQGGTAGLRLYNPDRLELRMGSGGGGGGADGKSWGGDSGHGGNGGSGGGIVYVRTGSLTNLGSVSVVGNRGLTAYCTPGTNGQEAGGGSSGAGGTVALYVADEGGDEGYYSDGVVLGVPGALVGDSNTAARFDGGSTQLELGSRSWLTNNSGSFGLSVWFRSESTAPNGIIYTERPDEPWTGSGHELSIILNSTATSGLTGRVSFIARGASSGIRLSSGTGMNDGQWHNVVVNKSGNAYFLYVDGVSIGNTIRSSNGNYTATNPGVVAVGMAAIGGPGGPMLVGAEPVGLFEGDIDEVAVFAGPLGPEVIRALHGAATEGAPGVQTYETLMQQAAPLAYWRLDETAGTTAHIHPASAGALGNVNVSGGWYSSNCSCGCGGRGGDGRFLVSRYLDDGDGDGVPDGDDVCPLVQDPAQLDTDGDRIGDACDLEPLVHIYGGSSGNPGRSCRDILEHAIVPIDGVRWIDPDGDGSGAFQVWCDQTTDGGGWTLMLAYAHAAGDERELDGTAFPTDPNAGWSHALLADHGVLAEQVSELRFHCYGSRHEAMVDFTTTAPALLAGALSGDQAWQPHDWSAEFTPAAAHSAALPAATDTVGNQLAASFTGAPFRAGETAQWAIAADGTRWGCDDAAPDGAATTLHQVWYR